MEHIAFVLWMVLWPLGTTIESYFSAKRRQITGEDHKDTNIFVVIIEIVIWIAVAKALF